jgi:hypothetical protein
MSEQEPVIETPVVVKYSSYTPAQKKATLKYRDANRDKVNQQRKAYYLTRKEADPQFLEYKRQKAKEYYLRKKLSAVLKTTGEPQLDSVADVCKLEEQLAPEPDVVSAPVLKVVATTPKKTKKDKSTKVEAVVPEVIKVVEQVALVAKPVVKPVKPKSPKKIKEPVAPV